MIKQWLRNWLGISALATAQDLADSQHEVATIRAELPRINGRLDKVNVLAQTGKLEAEALCAKVDAAMGAAIQNLQLQITALTSPDGPIAKAKPPEPEAVQMTRGMVRFSERKRAYEASKRKPLETTTGKQIEENARLIASGTRKAPNVD